MRLERNAGPPGEALGVPRGEFLEALRQHASGLFRPPRFGFGISGWPAILLACLLIAAVASLMYFWGVRWMVETAARFTPVWVEERLGRATVDFLATATMQCADPEREQALARIADRLAGVAGSDYKFRVVYLDVPEANALAAPGGYIVVFRGLLEQAATPEEFAGVLAHEMQHVLQKHSIRLLARELSGQALLSMMMGNTGGQPVSIAASLINLHYQRGDEEAADLGAMTMLANAQIRPDGMVAFFRRLSIDPSGSQPSIPYLSTHPAILERAAKVEAEARKIHSPSQPLMSPDEWAAARQVCR